jgi:DNA-binding NarL/FixJ family response regulator
MTTAPAKALAAPPARVRLVVDEDPATCDEAERLLAGAGVPFEMLACPSAKHVEAIERAVAARPRHPLVAVMPTGSRGTALRKALRAGACGIVLDDRLRESLIPTARAVLAGQLAIPPALRRQIAPRPLSYREKEILRLVVRGYTNRQIADALFVAESTVKTHLSSAFGKLDTRSRAEAAALILDPDEGYGLGILPATTSGTAEAA